VVRLARVTCAICRTYFCKMHEMRTRGCLMGHLVSCDLLTMHVVQHCICDMHDTFYSSAGQPDLDLLYRIFHHVGAKYINFRHQKESACAKKKRKRKENRRSVFDAAVVTWITGKRLVTSRHRAPFLSRIRPQQIMTAFDLNSPSQWLLV